MSVETCWYQWRSQALLRDFNVRHRTATLPTFEEWLRSRTRAVREQAALEIESAAQSLGLEGFRATALREGVER